MAKTASDTFDPLVLYDELVMSGRPPEPAVFAARYPDHPDLQTRIFELEALRVDLDGAVQQLGRAEHEWPAQVGSFSLGEQLGKGGMGAVFRAMDTRTGQVCALKLGQHESEIARKRFRREAELTQKLSHPGIARVFSYGVAGKVAYIAAELVEGWTLRDMLAAADGVGPETGAVPLPAGLPCRLEVMIAVAEALGCAHEAGVVHRDVKPSNIMVQKDLSPKLIDFGLAVPARPGRDRVTRTGVFVGSQNYAAPEQLLGKKSEVGPWTDTYAVGVTLFELLTGRTPFQCATFAGRAACAQLDPIQWARQLVPDLPRKLDTLLKRSLSVKPRKRFKDGNEMVRALRKCRPK